MESRKIPLTGDWDSYYSKLNRYRKKVGNCDVPFEWEKDPELAYWTEVQRNSKLRLARKKIDLLNQIGFNWKYEDLSWEAMFKRLKNYHREHFHAVIDQNDVQHHRLWRWLTSQRANMNLEKGKKKLLYDFLGDIEITTHRELKWELRFQELLRYREQHGNCRVTQAYKENPQLGRWVHKMRQACDKQSEYRIRRLTEIGFEFGRWEPTWEEQYEKLVQFRKKYGHTSPTGSYTDFPGLGAWVVAQRILNNRKQLSKDRKKSLDNINFDWHPFQTRWLNFFNGYKKLYGKYKGNIPYHLIKKLKFENWIYRQRLYFKEGKLSASQIRLLKSVKINLVHKPTTAWEIMFEELVKFKLRYGHFHLFNIRIRKKYSKLSAWVDIQRRKKKYKQLPRNRVIKLNSIGFVWDGNKGYSKKGIPRPRKHVLN